MAPTPPPGKAARLAAGTLLAIVAIGLMLWLMQLVGVSPVISLPSPVLILA